MGNQISQVTPSAPTVGIESYVDELGDIQYDKTCGSARFMKTVRGRHRDGVVIVKIFIKPIATIALDRYQDQLSRERRALKGVAHAVAYSKIVVTERAGYLVRQYFGDILYDRISIRPFLENIEKRWITFQLLTGLSQCHEKGVRHGDIKTENIVVTSWNWVFLSDFASFKPTFLPEDDPADFSFFFDTSLRRVCYVAPERFYKPDQKKHGSLTNAMDIFSLGCVIAELFLEGTPIFTLSQLLSYIQGSFTPDLSKIDDLEIRSLVAHMIQLSPTDRLSASDYLREWQDRAFPGYFYSFLHAYVQNVTEPSILDAGVKSLKAQYFEADRRIDKIYSDFDKIAYFLNFNYPQLVKQEDLFHLGRDPIPVYLDIPNYHADMPVSAISPPEDSGALLFLTIVTSAVRNTVSGRTRLFACELILALGEQLPDAAKLDRCLPYLVYLLDDKFANVKVSAMRSLTQLMSLVQTVSPGNENVFAEYIMPRLHPLLVNDETFIRANYAALVATLAESALKFIDIAQLTRFEDLSVARLDGANATVLSSSEDFQWRFNELRRKVVDIFQDITITLLTDSESAVKRALLRSISPLCSFFGSQKASDIILSHLITYLNDKDTLLRSAFFDAIIGLATFVGGNSLEEYIMPLMVQALADTEEIVIEKVLFAFTSLAELLIKRSNMWDLIRITIRFSMHPNQWIRQGVFSFVAACVRLLSPADVHCIVAPVVRQFLFCDILEYSEIMLSDFCKPPLSRTVFNAAIGWASESKSSNFWRPAREHRMSDIMQLFDPTYSVSNMFHGMPDLTSSLSYDYLDRMEKTEEDKKWILILQNKGLPANEFWKLVALREHIWRIAKASNTNMKIFPDRRETSSMPDFNSLIPVNKLENHVELHNYFFDDTRTAVRRYQRSAVSDYPGKYNHATGALVDALKTIEEHPAITGSFRRSSITESPRLGSSTTFLNAASRIPSNVSNVMRTRTMDSTTSIGDMSTTSLAPSSIAASVYERQYGSRTLRRRASVTTFRSMHEDARNVAPLKTVPDVGTSAATAYGEVKSCEHGASEVDSVDQFVVKKSQVTASATIVQPTGVVSKKMITEDGDTLVEAEMSEVPFYTGDDPYIYKLLRSVYMERYRVDIPEFGPFLPLGSIPRLPARYKTGSESSPNTWRPDGILIAHYEEHHGPINKVAIAPDHNFFLTASDDGSVLVWDSIQLVRNVTNRSRQRHKHAPGAKVRCLCFIENTYCFVSGATDGSIHVVRVDYSVSPDRNVPKYNRLSTLRSYKLQTGEYPVHIEHVKIESTSTLFVATNKSRIFGLDLRYDHLVYTFEFQNPLHHGNLTCFCVDRTQSWMAVGTSRGIIDIWSIRYRVRLKAWGLQGGTRIYKIAMHPVKSSNQFIWVAGGTSVAGDEITIWDVERTLCKEVFRPSDSHGSHEDMFKRYEPIFVDREPAETLLSRFANDPVQLLERNESSFGKGLRSMCLVALESPLDFQQNNFSSDFERSTSSRYKAPTNGSFLITGGADRVLRYWNICQSEMSFPFSGPLTLEKRPSYVTKNPTIARDEAEYSIVIHSEVRRGSRDMADGAEGATDVGSTVSGRVGSKLSKNPLITIHQQSTMRFHADAILDVGVLFKPYGTVISVDRAGSVKVYS
ncbi:uncharacterized protein V1516DRAFT_700700 [Lipomyces oligophaga]|uniref:uncharacterized protein n=1 Tax=Lipomyces oligophaga TaxID=45792 RepID=UPI0034CD4DDE